MGRWGWGSEGESELEGGWQLREWMWEWLGFSIVRGIYIFGYFSNFNLYGSGQVEYA